MIDPISSRVVNDENANPDYIYKVIVIGEASVGKSCIMIRAIKDEYNEDYDVTVGADSGTFMSRVNESNVQLQIWDTAGSEKFRSMIHVFFAGSEASLLVYDVTRKKSFEALDYWLKMLKDNTTSDILIILVGNKKDQEENRQVSYKEGEKYANHNNLFAFIETSAKTGEGIIDVFNNVCKTLYMMNKKPKEKGVSLSKKAEDKKGCC